MIFNERVFYKDRLGKVLDNEDSKVRTLEVVQLNDFLVNNLQMNVFEVKKPLLEDQENVAIELNQPTT